MDGMRKALIIANDVYEHEGLKHLLAPAADAEELARVLGDPRIGGFHVRIVRNEPAHVIQGQVEDLFSESRSEDLLLLHFSCHTNLPERLQAMPGGDEALVLGNGKEHIKILEHLVFWVALG